MIACFLVKYLSNGFLDLRQATIIDTGFILQQGNTELDLLEEGSHGEVFHFVVLNLQRIHLNQGASGNRVLSDGFLDLVVKDLRFRGVFGQILLQHQHVRFQLAEPILFLNQKHQIILV